MSFDTAVNVVARGVPLGEQVVLALLQLQDGPPSPMCPILSRRHGRPHASSGATQSCALMFHGNFQIVDSIGKILEPTFGVDVEPIEDQ
jgi:hypothetical protein